MKNILFVIDTLFQGGAETLVKDYSTFLKRDGYNVCILCLRRLNTDYERLLLSSGIKIHFLSDHGPYKSNSLIGKIITRLLIIIGFDKRIARKIIETTHTDVIHAHLFTLDLLRRINPDNNLKILYTVHSEPQKYWHGNTRLSRREFKACQWLISNKQMQLVALHESMKDELNKLYHVGNTLVVNNGIDFSKFDKALPRHQVRTSLKINEKTFVVGHVGRFVDAKNHLFLIETFSQLVKKKENSVLLLVGTGPLFELVSSKVKELNLEEKVLFLGNRTDVPDLMNAMDVFAFPSIFEGLGIVLIEAQKMGLPCIISDKIPVAASISNLTKVVPLDEGPCQWAEAMLNFKVQSTKYNGLDDWDMNKIIKNLENIYMESK